MRILIIGGTGLISTAITRELVMRGEDVTVYNRGNNSKDKIDGAKWIKGDRTDYPVFESQMSQAGRFDCVIDMICFLPEDAQSLVRAFKGRIEQLIFCSTVDVYNKPATHYPINEMEGRGPVSAYGENKAKCEDILLRSYEHGDFSLTIFRPAYTYGEGNPIIYTFRSNSYIDRIAKGKPIIVPGDGSCLWVTCYRDDVGRAFVAAVCNPKTFGKTYNTTGETWMTWNAFHQGVAQALTAPFPKLVHIPTVLLSVIAPNHPRPRSEIFSFNYIFDNSAAKADLGFCPTISWVDGARRTIQWLYEHDQVMPCENDPFEDKVIEAWERLGKNMVQELAKA
jgi:nucleoside-diphosphate-sugar epimerase